MLPETERGLINMKINISIRIILAALSLAAVSYETGQCEDLRSVVGTAREHSNLYSDMKIPVEVEQGTAQAGTAQKAANAINSPEFQARMQKEKERLQGEVFGDFASPAYYEDSANPKVKSAGKLAADERIYIFVSSSMPESTLRNYARDIERSGDPNIVMVMRGFVGGMRLFGPSKEFIGRMLLKDPGCESNCSSYNASVVIDPNLYRRFRPEVVPAVVYARGVKPSDPDRSEGDPTNVKKPSDNSWLMLYGDASLGYMFKRINEQAHSPALGALAAALSR